MNVSDIIAENVFHEAGYAEPYNSPRCFLRTVSSFARLAYGRFFECCSLALSRSPIGSFLARNFRLRQSCQGSCRQGIDPCHAEMRSNQVASARTSQFLWLRTRRISYLTCCSTDLLRGTKSDTLAFLVFECASYLFLRASCCVLLLFHLVGSRSFGLIHSLGSQSERRDALRRRINNAKQCARLSSLLHQLLLADRKLGPLIGVFS